MHRRKGRQEIIRTTMGTVLAALMCWGSANGQTADTRPAFEVASVRPAPPYVPGQPYQVRGGPGTDDPGQFTAPRASLMSLLATAYGVAFDQISGPDWLETEIYSVAAKIPPNTTKDRFNLMLQNLLAERFHLTLHHGTKDFTQETHTLAPVKSPSNARRGLESMVWLDCWSLCA